MQCQWSTNFLQTCRAKTAQDALRVSINHVFIETRWLDYSNDRNNSTAVPHYICAYVGARRGRRIRPARDDNQYIGATSADAMS
jgi:hypothetical protein